MEYTQIKSQISAMLSIKGIISVCAVTGMADIKNNEQPL